MLANNTYIIYNIKNKGIFEIKTTSGTTENEQIEQIFKTLTKLIKTNKNKHIICKQDA